MNRWTFEFPGLVGEMLGGGEIWSLIQAVTVSIEEDKQASPARERQLQFKRLNLGYTMGNEGEKACFVH